ncbi:MAG: ABC transporter ATP-binding protein [Hydrogenophaga sp.]|nr:ABC transporter ATP-binding protein [Hydrogenophaga sp.]
MSTPLLAVEGLHKRFPLPRKGLFQAHRPQLHAVDGVDLHIAAGASVGLVGESGCGKSTLARLLARLLDADSGRLLFQGQDLAAQPARRFTRDPARRAIQMVFQDSTDSLNPRFTAFDTIAEPLKLLERVSDRQALEQRVHQTAIDVGLPPELLTRFPHQLSGGQKARVNIARAIAVRPSLLVLDEPTAALDVSVQTVVLRLLDELRRQLGLAFLFVSHDLHVVRLMCDEVLVMYLGRIVERGPVRAVFDRPAHPYTRLLIDALPRAGAAPLAEAVGGEATSPVDPDPNRCRFAPRCPRVQALCLRQAPELEAFAPAGQELPVRSVACHFPEPAEPGAFPSSPTE